MLPEESLGEYLHNFGVDKDFLESTQKALTIKERKNEVILMS